MSPDALTVATVSTVAGLFAGGAIGLFLGFPMGRAHRRREEARKALLIQRPGHAPLCVPCPGRVFLRQVPRKLQADMIRLHSSKPPGPLSMLGRALEVVGSQLLGRWRRKRGNP